MEVPDLHDSHFMCSLMFGLVNAYGLKMLDIDDLA